MAKKIVKLGTEFQSYERNVCCATEMLIGAGYIAEEIANIVFPADPYHWQRDVQWVTEFANSIKELNDDR